MTEVRRTYAFQIQAGVNFRTETLEGRDCLVTPAVLLRELVVNEELVSQEVLQASVPAWNGRPVVLNHPRSVDGGPVSANAPKILEKSRIGYIFHNRMKDDRLTAEVYFDVKKMQDIGGKAVEMLSAIRRQEQVEVSTGYFVKVDTSQSGVFKGRRYEGAQRDILPDHLAVLTDEEGACDWGDGCGVPRVASSNNNHNQGGVKTNEMTVKEQLKQFFEDAFGWTIRAHDQVVRPVKACEHCGTDHDEVKFVTHKGSSGDRRLVGVCPTTQTPIVTDCNGDNGDRLTVNGRMLGQVLTKIVNERVEVVGKSRDSIVTQLAAAADVDTSVVEKVMSGGVDYPSDRMLTAFSTVLEASLMDLYLAVSEDKRPRRDQGPFANQTDKEGDELTREQVMDALCANKALVITDEAKTALLALEKDVDFFTKLSELQATPKEAPAQNQQTAAAVPAPVATPAAPAAAVAPVAATVVPAAAQVAPVVAAAAPVVVAPVAPVVVPVVVPEPESPKNLEQWITDCPDADYREHQMQQMADVKQERKALTEKLTANGFTEDEVKAMSLGTLKKFSEKISPTPNYSGGRPVPQPNTGAMGPSGEGAPDPPPVLLAKAEGLTSQQPQPQPQQAAQ